MRHSARECGRSREAALDERKREIRSSKLERAAVPGERSEAGRSREAALDERKREIRSSKLERAAVPGERSEAGRSREGGRSRPKDGR
jgi:hypothetical protein